MTLLFLHGWGFDAQLWTAVRRLLEPMPGVAWDRGYFGEPQTTPVAGPVVAVGHSLGGMILAAAPPPGCVGLIAINGFDRFVGEQATSARALDRMRRRFAEAPRDTLDAFRARCGAAPHRGDIDAARLAADLDRLARDDARGCGVPRLMLQGGVDPLLPPAMRATTFPGAPREELADGGHLLPLTHPEWCAARIRAALP